MNTIELNTEIVEYSLTDRVNFNTVYKGLSITSRLLISTNEYKLNLNEN